ncbi:MAG: hypothetical protein GTN86_08180 [Xanthomonadales bacterium]|nr:hypothetical protein [Xanthomonadales bacterium]NIN59847.1 hypothetical protein [Xanthomonadales bacterium]NIN75221.1 hypothetical protein [Xanthomonadales bacterium]NIO13463.1 hypothetical protein [Xanthomonadales bacterium]NIP12240.1 hypothetical protein [Xanthomonadales bacterium]
MAGDSSTDLAGLQATVLDHASEFVALVHAAAPGRYRELLDAPRIKSSLAEDNAFNHGKVFVYAEYDVFRAEFRRRFPQASGHACINAFCKLFLKNDISITRLVEAIERSPRDERQQLTHRD